MYPTTSSLVGIIDHAREGHVVLPEFQRSFIWDRSAIEELLVSVFNEYFIGSLLTLNVEPESVPFRARTIEGIEGVNVRPEKMILDGQQRITSIHYALYGPDIPLKNTSYPYRFFIDVDKAVEGRWDEAVVSWPTYYKSITPLFGDWQRQYEEGLIGLSALRSGLIWTQWYMGYQRYLQELGDFDQGWLDSLFRIAETFLKYHVAMIELPRSTPLETVVEVFERINRTGSPLGIFELLTARLWKADIQLRDLWKRALAEHSKLAEVAGSKGGRYRRFVLQVMALLRGRECKRKDLILLDAECFEEDWNRATAAVEHALRRMHSTASGGYGIVPALSPPYSTLVTPLAVMLDHIGGLDGERGGAYEKLHRWYWSSVFRERYGGSTETLSQRDCTQLRRWIEEDGAVPEAVPTQDDQIQRDLAEVVRAGAVYRGVLSLVALKGARDFFTGDTIELHELDDHHVFPNSFLKGRGLKADRRNTILNRTLISSDTNRRLIGSKQPSKYLAKMETELGKDTVREILATHFINDAAIEAMRSDDYQRFLVERERALRAEILRRCIFSTIGAIVTPEEGIAPGEEDERLDRLESAMRDLIDETLQEIEGDSYWKRLVPQDIRSAVVVRLKEQESLHPRADGHPNVSHRARLDFCDFSDYSNIVRQRNVWPAFEAVFGRESEFERHITAARRYRNSLKHARQMEAVDRLTGHAAVLWLEKAIGQTRFSDRVIAGNAPSVEDCLRVLTRRHIPDGQRSLYRALIEAGSSGATKAELVEEMDRRDEADLAGVLGALGNRVNRTPGFGESRRPGIDMLLELDDAEEELRYRLKPIMREALRRIAPSWLSGLDLSTVDEASKLGKREVTWERFVIKELESGKIEVERDGEAVSPAKPELQRIAEALGQSTLNGAGNAFNTRQLGRKLIDLLSGGDLTDSQRVQLEFWTAFKEFVDATAATLRSQKPSPASWTGFAIGRAGFSLSAVASWWNSADETYETNEIRAELAIDGDHAGDRFGDLKRRRAEIEEALGFELEWYEMDGVRMRRAFVRRTVDLRDRDAWPDYREWLLEHLESLERVFRPIAAEL